MITQPRQAFFQQIFKTGSGDLYRIAVITAVIYSPAAISRVILHEAVLELEFDTQDRITFEYVIIWRGQSFIAYLMLYVCSGGIFHNHFIKLCSFIPVSIAAACSLFAVSGIVRFFFVKNLRCPILPKQH